MSDAAGEKLVHIKMTQGDDLSWSVLKVSIVVDGGNSLTCADAAKDDGTADCTYMIDETTPGPHLKKSQSAKAMLTYVMAQTVAVTLTSL